MSNRKSRKQLQNITDEAILNYLAKYQGEWTCIWFGYFKDETPDVYHAMPKGTPPKVAFSKMKSLFQRDLIGGCPCGCRGDFEITDKGLKLIGVKRTKDYTGY